MRTAEQWRIAPSNSATARDWTSVWVFVGILLMATMLIVAGVDPDGKNATIAVSMLTVLAASWLSHHGHRLQVSAQRASRPHVEVGACVADPEADSIHAVLKNAGLGPAINVRVQVVALEREPPKGADDDAEEMAAWLEGRQQSGEIIELTPDPAYRGARIASIQVGGGYGVELEDVMCEQLCRWDRWPEWKQLIDDTDDEGHKNALKRAAHHLLAATRYPGVSVRLACVGGQCQRVKGWLDSGGFADELSFRLTYEDASGGTYDALSVLVPQYTDTWLIEEASDC